MTRTIAIQPAAPLSADQRQSLRLLLAIMIPASTEFDVPGADDDAIVADLITSMRPEQVAPALAQLDARSGGRFGALDAAGRHTAALAWLADPTPAQAALTALVLQCYYRDDRVMRSLNMEPRAPFPKGFELEQGDWSLLDPVRKGPRVYREAP